MFPVKLSVLASFFLNKPSSLTAGRLTSCGAGRMPVERTEHRRADELFKYYEVYETIGSGNDNVVSYQ